MKIQITFLTSLLVQNTISLPVLLRNKNGKKLMSDLSIIGTVPILFTSLFLPFLSCKSNCVSPTWLSKCC